MRKKNSDDLIKKQQEKRLNDAKNSFEKMMDIVNPFIKKQHFKKVSTADAWCDASMLSLCGDVCVSSDNKNLPQT